MNASIMNQYNDAQFAMAVSVHRLTEEQRRSKLAKIGFVKAVQTVRCEFGVSLQAAYDYVKPLYF